jgi:hypothetical protein
MINILSEAKDHSMRRQTASHVRRSWHIRRAAFADPSWLRSSGSEQQ